MSQNEKTVELSAAETRNRDRAGKYLTFELNQSEFGIEILKVVEILKMIEITKVPMWPDFASGTINLRGRVIPVVDLRQKFGLSAIEETDQTCTVVVEICGDQIGIVVESVNEVREISEDNIVESPNIGGTVNSEFILGMGKTDTNTILLLNLENILVGGEMDELLEAGSQQCVPA
jgi:purine-binding chemotaxis protein CheW